MEKENNKKIIISVIVGFCLISMLVALGHFTMLFRLSPVFSPNVWDLNKKELWKMTLVLIFSAITMVTLSIVVIMEFFGKKGFGNKIKLCLIISSIVSIILTTIGFTLII